MKIKITHLLLTLGLITFSVQSQAQDPNFHIYLCFGQSNMEGQGTIGSQDQTVDNRFQVLQAVDCSNINRQATEWYPAIPPLCRCWNGLSPADYFGRTLIASLPSHINVGVVNVAVGGCRIELFDKDIYEDYLDTYKEDWFQNALDSYDRNPYNHLLSLAKQAQEVGVIKGILLHQGESNAGDAQWPTKVKKIYDDLLSDLDMETNAIPLLAGEMVHEDQGGSLASMNKIVAQLPEIIPNAHIISSSGCSDKDDNIHFDAAGYRELGIRYGEKMLSLLEYDANAPILHSESNTTYSLSTVYPNPVDSYGQIDFSLPKATHVKLKLYNTAGQEVTQILNKPCTLGHHSISYDFASVPRGVYYYRLETNEKMLSKKVLIH